MHSFTTLSDTPKQNLPNIIQELHCSNFNALLKELKSTSPTPPSWIQWLFLKKSTDYSIEELVHEYTQLENPGALTIASQCFGLSTEEEKTKLSYAIELGKLAIQKAALNSLAREHRAPLPPDKPSILKQILYWVLFPLGTIIAICQGFDGVRSLLELLGIVTTISTWPIILCSIVGAFFACALYYAFELEFLKEQLGLSDTHYLKDKLSIYEEQINTIIEIENNLLLTADKDYTVTELKHYLQLCQKFNANIIGIKNSIQPYKESMTKKILRYCIMKAGILLAIGDTLYTITGLLGMTVLNSNPLNMICLTLLAFGAAVFFTVSYVDHIYATLNSSAQQINSIKEKAEHYHRSQLLHHLQEKLAKQKRLKLAKERLLNLEQQLKIRSQEMAEQQVRLNNQKSELALWKMWRKAKHTTRISPPVHETAPSIPLRRKSFS